MSFTSLIPPIYYNVKHYGAAGNGSTDDTSSIQSAISAASGGGIIFFPPGTYKVSSPIALSSTGLTLQGSGTTATILQISGTFSGASVINITSSFSAVRELSIEGASGSYGSNPAADAIQITGVTHVNISDIYFQAINGWQVQSTGTGSTANYNIHVTECRGYQCKKGFHCIGNTGTGFSSVHVFLNCYATQVQNGDCYLFEDVQDIQATNIFGECAAGSGNSIHIKGACSSVYIFNVDLGPYPGPTTGAVVLIESSSNGSPNQCGIFGGIIEGGTSGIQITAGTNLFFKGLQIFNNGTYGILTSGGDSTIFEGLMFANNGSAGSSGRYDMQLGSGNNTMVEACYFNTAQGSTAGTVNNVINNTSGFTTVQHCFFKGTGFNSSNIFNGYPSVIRNCPGYNPLGSTSPPTVGASPLTVGPYAQDYTVYIKGGTVSQIQIGGNTTGLTLSSGQFVTVVLPAGLSLEVTYSAAPTWSWYGN